MPCLKATAFLTPHTGLPIFFSLSWVSKTQPNPWTKPMTSAWLTTQDTRNCPGPEDRSLPTDNLRINVCVFLSTELTALLLKGFLLHRRSYTLKLAKAIEGYRSSLLETVRQAPTIVAQGGPSWAQYMWQQRQSVSIWCWFQDGDLLWNSSSCPRHPHLNRSPFSRFSISLLFQCVPSISTVLVWYNCWARSHGLLPLDRRFNLFLFHFPRVLAETLPGESGIWCVIIGT